jgi:AcrR family transcriptional regulator
MKNEILQTSLKQFLKYGIREMSIQKLIAPLGISTKTVYKYFKNKEELLAEALQLFYSQQYELFEDRAANQSAVILSFDIWYEGIELQYKVNKVFFQDLHYYYPALERKMDIINGKRFWKRFIQIIHTGIEEGVFRKDVNPEVVLEGIAVLYLAIVRKGQFKKFGVSPYEILLNTIAPCVRGICTEKGVRQLDKRIAAYDLSGKINVSKEKMATSQP